MYEQPASSVYPDVVKLAGGAEAVVKLALARIQAGQPVEALHLTDMALAAEATNQAAWQARLKALELLLARCRNSNERGWLMLSINETKTRIAAAGTGR